MTDQSPKHIDYLRLLASRLWVDDDAFDKVVEETVEEIEEEFENEEKRRSQ